MYHTSAPLNKSICRNARLSRDARFDGLFFTGVLTTGIFCRPICPATPAKESNVNYYPTASSAAQAGLRPCLRCRPESAPGSPAWQGVQTTLSRAVRLIDQGEWRGQSSAQFAARLGISDRYLRKLFAEKMGISPLKYVNFKRTMFAKQLLQQTNLLVADVAAMAGFGSTRRFNTVFAELLNLNPLQLRRVQTLEVVPGNNLSVLLSYRPPYNWAAVHEFYRMRQIPGLEILSDTSYSRSFRYQDCEGVFIATHQPDKNSFHVDLTLSQPGHSLAIIQRIRRLLDLDADAGAIACHLANNPLFANLNSTGIRLPGVWSAFEAGVRAILGQQVSVKAAHNLVTRLLTELGKPLPANEAINNIPILLFPEPEEVAASSLEFLAMPNKRRQALRLLAKYLLNKGRDENVAAGINNKGQEISRCDESLYQDWLAIPGIGPWTVQYTAFRMGHPDIFLAGDLGVKNALKKLSGNSEKEAVVDAQAISPWGSYATLLLWQALSDTASATTVRVKQ